MKIEEIKQLKSDIKAIREIESVVKAFKGSARYDKVDFGFNKDSRFAGSGDVNVWLGGYKGVYGSSCVSSIFEVRCQKEFKSALIEVLNELRPQILQMIADKMQAMLNDQSGEILKEIKRLQSLYDDVNS